MPRFLIYSNLCLMMMVVLLSHACTYNKPDIKPAVNCASTMPQVVSFTRDIKPILSSNCATAGCHSGSTPEGNLNLEPSLAYSQLKQSGTGYIDTTDPKGSVLYSSIVSVSDPMPPLGKLDPCSIELILKWMQQGALNN